VDRAGGAALALQQLGDEKSAEQEKQGDAECADRAEVDQPGMRAAVDAGVVEMVKGEDGGESEQPEQIELGPVVAGAGQDGLLPFAVDGSIVRPFSAGAPGRSDDWRPIIKVARMTKIKDVYSRARMIGYEALSDTRVWRTGLLLDCHRQTLST
jgi:hypothetical protein